MKKTARIALVTLCCAALLALVACGGNATSSSSKSASSFASDPGSASTSGGSGTATSVYGKQVSTAPEGVKYILVIGNDQWENKEPHADMNCILRVDFDKHSITEITVPRDTKVKSPDGDTFKLLWIFTGWGAEEQTRQAADIYGVPIDFYVTIGFDGLQKLVDNFSGLDVNLPYPIDYHFYTNDYPDVHIDAGQQVLDAWQTMVTSRSRVSYGDYVEAIENTRQAVDRQMLTNLMKAAYAKSDNIDSLFSAFQGSIESNLPLEAQVAWAKKLGETGTIEVTGVTGPFWGQNDDELNGDWACYPDPDGWDNLRNAIENDGNLDAAVMSYKYTNYPEKVDPVSHTTISVK